MLTRRVISNVGQPLCTPSGAPLPGIKISFILIDTTGKKNNAWDAISGERVEGLVQTTTDASGEFSVELWPNDRGATVTQYLCRVAAAGISDFIASVPSGATTLSWIEFMAQGATLTSQQIVGLEYIANRDISSGYVGLTLFKHNFINALGTIKSFFTNANTAARTYTFPDKDITVAGLSDITGINSGTNTGDQTLAGLGGVPATTTVNGHPLSANVIVTPADLGAEVTANKGAANGYAPLDAGAKIPLANIPASVIGALSYQGTWNAATNTPALASGVGTKGYYYKVSVAGATSLDGHAVWSVDDVAVFDGAAWDVLQGGISSAEVTNALGFTPLNKAGDAMTGALTLFGDPTLPLHAVPLQMLQYYVSPVNNIGIAGRAGFGIGICPVVPAGFSALAGTNMPSSDTYGNYQYSDGSIMCWIPAFYYKYGTGANGLAINMVDIQPESVYASVAVANAAGYALHRAFYDSGVVQRGVFIDKYKCSNNAGTASSIKFGNPLSSNGVNNPFSGLTGAPANNYSGAIASAKTRGVNFFSSSLFIRSALALLALAHAQASTSTTRCAWYNATNNFPKGCNNNALGDAQDAALTFISSGYSTANQTGSANVLAKTTHNGQNCGVADVNGTIWEISLGLTSDATNYYLLKTSAQMKAITAGNTLATDAWGATGIAALYDNLGATFGALWATAANRVTYFGSATQVLNAAINGNAWNAAGAGIPLIGGVSGTNSFGNDGLWDYKPNEMCPIVADS